MLFPSNLQFALVDLQFVIAILAMVPSETLFAQIATSI